MCFPSGFSGRLNDFHIFGKVGKALLARVRPINICNGF
jgi:hypothetical protein